MACAAALESLSRARVIADHAERVGISFDELPQRPSSSHIGALLADAILQSGLNYRSVVKPRVDRILALYPEAAVFPGLIRVLEQHGASEFLSWHHTTKITRFLNLVSLLDAGGLRCAQELRAWLGRPGARAQMLALNGVGPKTYDYICCLVGMDHIAVDRHVKAFADEAGVPLRSYDELHVAVSFAADLLGLARRDFDAWIWRRFSKPPRIPDQYALL